MARELILTKSVTDIIASWKHNLANIVDVVSHSLQLLCFLKKLKIQRSHVKVIGPLWISLPMLVLLNFWRSVDFEIANWLDNFPFLRSSYYRKLSIIITILNIYQQYINNQTSFSENYKLLNLINNLCYHGQTFRAISNSL